MHDGRPRHYAGHQDRRSRPREGGFRPDRVALWAVFMAVIAMIAAAASSAQGASGGVGDPETVESKSSCDRARFGERKLSRGDCGTDVKTLNWILNSNKFGRKAPLGKSFKGTTKRGVAKLQRRKGLPTSGVVNRRTRKKLVRSMKRSVATWYGPGFYGNRTACGQRLTRKTVGVAHKRLPCGTRVTVKYKGRYLRTRVIDRGPYAHGASWDLTSRAAKKLRFTHTDKVRAAAVR